MYSWYIGLVNLGMEGLRIVFFMFLFYRVEDVGLEESGYL